MRIFVIIAIIALAGCHRHIAPQASTDVFHSDTVTVEYFYHDTLITPAPAIAALHDTIPCPGLNYEKEVHTNNQHITVKSHGGILDVTCAADSLQQIIHVLSQKITETKLDRFDSTIVVTKIVNVPVTHTPAFMWWSLGINILLLIVIYFEFTASLSGGSLIATVFGLIRKIKL